MPDVRKTSNNGELGVRRPPRYAETAIRFKLRRVRNCNQGLSLDAPASILIHTLRHTKGRLPPSPLRGFGGASEPVLACEVTAKESAQC